MIVIRIHFYLLFLLQNYYIATKIVFMEVGKVLRNLFTLHCTTLYNWFNTLQLISSNI